MTIGFYGNQKPDRPIVFDANPDPGEEETLLDVNGEPVVTEGTVVQTWRNSSPDGRVGDLVRTTTRGMALYLFNSKRGLTQGTGTAISMSPRMASVGCKWWLNSLVFRWNGTAFNTTVTYRTICQVGDWWFGWRNSHGIALQYDSTVRAPSVLLANTSPALFQWRFYVDANGNTRIWYRIIRVTSRQENDWLVTGGIWSSYHNTQFVRDRRVRFFMGGNPASQPNPWLGEVYELRVEDFVPGSLPEFIYTSELCAKYGING